MVTVETLKAFLEAFNRHDTDAILEFFADDSVMELTRGPDPWERSRFERAVTAVLKAYPTQA